MNYLKPTGNLAAFEPAEVIVTPIAAVNVAVGDIVQFDFVGGSAPRSDLTKVLDWDNNRNPFNVVILGSGVVGGSEGGIWGVVTEAASAGRRCKVCIHGVVRAKVTTTGNTPAGAVYAPVAANVLGAPVSGANPAVAVGLEAANTVTAALTLVLFDGYKMGSTAA